ncbi:tubulin binding cofactor C-domain-containing protein, partial [Dimargaris cristalligena]
SSSSKERSELGTRQARVQLAILDLEGKVTQALVFLPAYDERLYKQQIQELKAAAKRQKDALAPKARFSFRTKTAPTKKAPVPLNEPTHTTADPAATLADFADSYHTIGALPSSDATSDQTSTLSSSYKVRNGRNSIINCLPTGGQLRSLFLYELRHCLVLVGPVAGSVFLEACHDCVIVVACRQLRIHTSHHLTFYLHAASHPIIEDCDKISNRTAASETTRTIWERAALLETANLYDQVNDFKWLRRQASPHWRV